MSERWAEPYITEQQAIAAGWERGSLEFTSYIHWVCKAHTWIGGTGAKCFDAKGRECRIGKDFMRARDEEAFPVSYYFPPGSHEAANLRARRAEAERDALRAELAELRGSR